MQKRPARSRWHSRQCIRSAAGTQRGRPQPPALAVQFASPVPSPRTAVASLRQVWPFYIRRPRPRSRDRHETYRRAANSALKPSVRGLRDSRPDLLDRTALSCFAAARRVAHRPSDLEDERPVGLELVGSLRLERRLRGLQGREGLALDLVGGRGEAEPSAVELCKLADELTRAALLRLCDVLTQR